MVVWEQAAFAGTSGPISWVLESWESELFVSPPQSGSNFRLVFVLAKSLDDLKCL